MLNILPNRVVTIFFCSLIFRSFFNGIYKLSYISIQTYVFNLFQTNT